MTSSSLYHDLRLPQHSEFLRNMPRIRSEHDLPVRHTRRLISCSMSPRHLLAAFLLAFVIFLLYSHQVHDRLASIVKLQNPNLIESSQIFVVSLPRRQDRRIEMERVRLALGLNWNYVSATDSGAAKIPAVFSHVRAIRSISLNSTMPIFNKTRLPFDWPTNIDSLAQSNVSLDAAELGFWETPLSGKQHSVPILRAEEDFTIRPFYANVAEHKILTPGRVACWDSHLSVIKNIAHSLEHDIGFIIEDDVDMERDLRERLGLLWPSLPADWDMVFLGHCWSNESYYPAITSVGGTSLHPSKNPQCTHAYALSRKGARRLFLHLVYAPFAYSRAIDQAFAWLIHSRRLKSYSVVPSVIVQRKTGRSDVSLGLGSRWKDTLRNGVF